MEDRDVGVYRKNETRGDYWKRSYVFWQDFDGEQRFEMDREELTRKQVRDLKSF